MSTDRGLQRSTDTTVECAKRGGHEAHEGVIKGWAQMAWYAIPHPLQNRARLV